MNRARVCWVNQAGPWPSNYGRARGFANGRGFVRGLWPPVGFCWVFVNRGACAAPLFAGTGAGDCEPVGGFAAGLNNAAVCPVFAGFFTVCAVRFEPPDRIGGLYGGMPGFLWFFAGYIARTVKIDCARFLTHFERFS